ncbi:hypothetical protein Leryth_016654 [Lithospermum erythrorhizon]|nr:hypothetical protein Leryth_016654 [Lithospermum erythrorhizon]
MAALVEFSYGCHGCSFADHIWTYTSKIPLLLRLWKSAAIFLLLALNCGRLKKKRKWDGNEISPATNFSS